MSELPVAGATTVSSTTTTAATSATDVLAELFKKYPELAAAAKTFETKTVTTTIAAPSFFEKVYLALVGYFRMSGWGLAVVALAVAIYFLMPQEFEVALWKSAMVAAAAYAGYWFDRTLFPYARPHAFNADDTSHMWSTNDPTGHVFVGSMIRRAIIVVGTMVAVALAL